MAGSIYSRQLLCERQTNSGKIKGSFLLFIHNYLLCDSSSSYSINDKNIFSTSQNIFSVAT